MIKLVLAVDRQNAIGWSDGKLPWHLPEDLKRFKNLTTGGTVLMGFNTYKSLNRVNGLPNRENYVLTKKPFSELIGQTGPDIKIISGLGFCEQFYQNPSKDIWIIGGAFVYDQIIDKGWADEIHLTIVDTVSGADVAVKHDFATWKRFLLQLNSKSPDTHYWTADVSFPIGAEGVIPSIYVTFKKT